MCTFVCASGRRWCRSFEAGWRSQQRTAPRSRRTWRLYNISIEFVVGTKRWADKSEVKEAVFMCCTAEGCLLRQAAVRTPRVEGAACLRRDVSLARQGRQLMIAKWAQLQVERYFMFRGAMRWCRKSKSHAFVQRTSVCPCSARIRWLERLVSLSCCGLVHRATTTPTTLPPQTTSR